MNDVEEVLKNYGKFNKDKRPRVTVTLMDGVELKGTIIGIGKETIVFADESGASEVVFKHAISKIK